MDNAELFEAEKKGRGLRSTRDLKAGEMVFSEPGFAAVVLESVTSQVCHSCFRRQANLHSCAVCHFAHYCDRTCQGVSWDWHKHECDVLKRRTSAPSANIRLVARILWRMQKHSGIISDTQLVPVDSLKDQRSDMSSVELDLLQNDIKHFLDYWPGKPQPEELVAHLLAMIKCNAVTLSDQRGQQSVGLGLFPNVALVNHDCWPNCTVTLNHGNQSAVNSSLHSKRRVELRALENIPEGTELTISYVDFLQLSSDRQVALQQQYHFTCSCQHCADRTKDDLMGAALDTAAAAEVTAFSKDSLEKMEAFRSKGNFHEVLQIAAEVLSKQQGVLADTHLLVLRTLSLAFEASALMQKFPQAAEYSARMLGGYTKLYHHNSGKLGVAAMRAGVAHWHAGLIEAGHALICQAYAILMVSHGPNHVMTRDLEAIRRQTEQELKLFNAAKQQPMSARH